MKVLSGSALIYLAAGEMHYTDKPAVIVTVLGSCLSVTMRCARLGIAGMSHGLMPSCERKRTCCIGCREEPRYVECAIMKMMAHFDKAGARRAEIEVKCFGGADLFVRSAASRDTVSIGRQNIQTAETVLKREGLRIRNQDTGGVRGRKIFFDTATGEVLLKRLAAAAPGPEPQKSVPRTMSSSRGVVSHE